MDEAKLNQAKAVYQTFCEMLDQENWKYTKQEEEWKITTGARGEDLPIDLTINVDVKRSLLMIISPLPFKVPEDKRVELAAATCTVNSIFVNGYLDYDVAGGSLFFRIANSFLDSRIDAETCKYMLFCACSTIDDINDKLLMVCKGMLDLDKFAELLNK